MATIEQRKPHAYPKEEARKKAEGLAEELKARADSLQKKAAQLK